MHRARCSLSAVTTAAPARIHAGPSPHHWWGWRAATKEHSDFGEAFALQADGGGRADAAAQGWIMMVRHGLSVANMQKDVFKGECDERFIDAPLSPQGRHQSPISQIGNLVYPAGQVRDLRAPLRTPTAVDMRWYQGATAVCISCTRFQPAPLLC